MNFALSVSLLAEVLSRTADIDGTAQTAPALLKTLASDEVLTMTLDLDGLDPTQITVTQLAINGVDRRAELSTRFWTSTNGYIDAAGAVSYHVIHTASNNAPLLVSAVFEPAQTPLPPSWDLQNTAQGAIEILASVPNSPAPALTDQADGYMLISA